MTVLDILAKRHKKQEAEPIPVKVEKQAFSKDFVLNFSKVAKEIGHDDLETCGLLNELLVMK